MSAKTKPAAAAQAEPEAFPRTVNREAMRRLDAEIEAKQRAQAEREAAETKKVTPEPKQQPETRAPSIREFLDSVPGKAFHAHSVASSTGL